jgi:hypothetical protein
MISVGKYEPADSSDGWNKMNEWMTGVTTRRDGTGKRRNGTRKNENFDLFCFFFFFSRGCVDVDGDVYDDDIIDDVVDHD